MLNFFPMEKKDEINSIVESFSKMSTPTKTRLLMRLLSGKEHKEDLIIQQEVNSELIQEKMVISSLISDSPLASATVINDPVLPKPTHSSNKRKFEDKEKVKIVIRAIQAGNNSAIAREEQIDESTIRKWKVSLKDNPAILKSETKKTKRNFHAKWPEMESKLNDWIDEQRDLKLAVSMNDIILEGKRLMRLMYPNERFSGSNGWFWRFTERNNLSRRVPTHVMQQITSDSKAKIDEYLKQLKKFQFETLLESNLNSAKKIIWINTDQIPCFMDLSSGRTYHRKGEKTIEVKATTGTRLRFTIMPTILSEEGAKGPLYLIFKSKQKSDIPNNYKNHLIIRHNSVGWIKEDLYKDWIDRILLNLKVSEEYTLALVVDQCKVHLKESIKKYLKQNNINYFFIPSGCTGLLQPLDVCINKPFKDAIRNQFSEWFKVYGSTQENKTNNGYLRPPSFENVSKWVLTAWNNIENELVKKSFQYCGIDINL